jgi:putative flippase GtrA
MALHIQVIRYAVVGIASNLTFYRLYLAITAFGVGPKSSMTGLHLLGMQQTFIFSKRWTFLHDAAHQGPFTRYLLAYTFGYLLNFAALLVLIDWAHWPHQVVQGMMIFILAAMLFLLQKYWVFAKASLSC